MVSKIFYTIDNNIYSFLLLAIFSHLTFMKVNKNSKVIKYLKHASTILMIQLVFETLSYLLQISEKNIIFKDNIIYIITVVLIITALLIPYTIVMFLLYKTNYTNYINIKKIISFTPVIIGMGLLIYNFFNPIMFSVENGLLQKNKFYFLFFILDFVPFLSAIIVVLINRKKIVKREYSILIIFLLTLFLGLIFKAVITVRFIIYPCMALALSIELFFIKITSTQYDNMTKLLTRDKGEEILSELIEDRKNIVVTYIESKKILEIYQTKTYDVIIDEVKKITNIIIENSSNDSIKIRYDINKILLIYIDTPIEKVENECKQIKQGLGEKNIQIETIIKRYNAEENLTKGQFLRSLEFPFSKRIQIRKEEIV